MPDAVGVIAALHGARWRRTWVAVSDSEVVEGFATLAENQVHGSRTTIFVEVREDRRKMGRGRALIEHALASRLDDRPLACKVWSDDAAAMALVGVVGGTPYQRCLGPAVDPTSPEVNAWAARHVAPSGVKIDTLERVEEAELAAAWVSQYGWVHERWSPVTSNEALETIAAEEVAELDRSVSCGAWVDGRLAAISFVYEEGDGEHSMVAETLRRTEPQGCEIVAATVAESLRRLGERGVTSAEFDGHCDDPHLAPVIKSMPVGQDRQLLLIEIARSSDQVAARPTCQGTPKRSTHQP